MKKLLFFINFFILFSTTFKVKPMVFEIPTYDGIEFHTIYGTFKVTEPVLLDLINHPAIRRLEAMPQAGPSHFVMPYIIYRAKKRKPYTRFDHSINCMLLVRKKLRNHKAFSEKEKLELQIAALLHDVSHGMMSHVIDLVMIQEGRNSVLEEAYQDKILGKFLNQHNIVDILNTYEISFEKVIPTKSNPNYALIKQGKNQLCIDNIEYTLSECYLTGLLSKHLIRSIVKNLNYNRAHRYWYFTNISLAKKFGYASINSVNLNSGASWNVILYNLFALIIKELIKENKLSVEDITYNQTDIQFWRDLNSKYRNTSKYINEIMKFIDKMKKRQTTFTTNCESVFTANKIQTKFRATDPYVKINNNQYKKLSKINATFRSRYKEGLNRSLGRTVGFLDPNHPLAKQEVISGC